MKPRPSRLECSRSSRGASPPAIFPTCMHLIHLLDRGIALTLTLTPILALTIRKHVASTIARSAEVLAFVAHATAKIDYGSSRTTERPHAYPAPGASAGLSLTPNPGAPTSAGTWDKTEDVVLGFLLVQLLLIDSASRSAPSARSTGVASRDAPSGRLATPLMFVGMDSKQGHNLGCRKNRQLYRWPRNSSIAIHFV